MLESKINQTRALPGVSVIICSHNGAGRIVETLKHLAGQQFPEYLPWEVILVDNGSTDDTVEVSLGFWPETIPAPLRVVYEPKLGRSNALRAGWKATRYPIVCTVDDDNWLDPLYIWVTASVMHEQ